MSDLARKRCLALLHLFKIGDKRADEVVTPGQLEIFYAIVSRKWNRVHIETASQYGKSLFVALGCIVLSTIEGELIPVLAPTNEKAKIIMRYYIQHLSDSPVFYEQLQKDTDIEKLQMETSKDRIVLKNKGGLYTLSVQAGNTQKGFEAAMGEGANVVIQDESALIPDEIEATCFRMIAGRPNGTYIKIGNPWKRNHFYKSSLDARYHKITIDYKQGIQEGRFTQAFIDEAKGKPFFSILFENKFPAADMMDEGGWVRLFSDELIERAQRPGVMPYGERRLGCDIAEGGGDDNAFVLRTANYAYKVAKFKVKDTMETTGLIMKTGKDLEVFDQNWFVDNLGVGKGVWDRLREQKKQPFGVRFSNAAVDSTQFLNQRAECYWSAFKWLNEGGTLEPDLDWQELAWIKYKVNSQGKIQIIAKEDLIKQGYHSPNVADAFVSTFARKTVVNVSREQIARERAEIMQYDSYLDRKKKIPSYVRV